jgi:hypothetical protein
MMVYLEALLKKEKKSVLPSYFNTTTHKCVTKGRDWKVDSVSIQTRNTKKPTCQDSIELQNQGEYQRWARTPTILLSLGTNAMREQRTAKRVKVAVAPQLFDAIYSSDGYRPIIRVLHNPGKRYEKYVRCSADQ